MCFIICLILLCLTVASVCLSTPLRNIVVLVSEQILTTPPRFLAIMLGTPNLCLINEVVDTILDFGAHVKALCVGLSFDTLSPWIFCAACVCLLTMAQRSAELGEDEHDVKPEQHTLPSPFSATDAEVDVFAPASPPSEQFDYAPFGIPRLSIEDSLWKTSDFVEPSVALPGSVHFDSLKASRPSLASAFVSVVTAPVCSLASLILSHTSRCVSLVSSSSSALRSRYLSFASAHVSSAPSSLDLASLSSLVSSRSGHRSLRSTAGSESKCAHRRMFGMVVPVRSAPRQFGIADLEIEDGSYLRAALGIADTDGADEGGFWPEIDGYVQCARDGRPGAWYTDGDEMRGWIFPGRELVPEFEYPEEDVSSESSGEWTVADDEVYEVLQRMAEVVDC
ncbi:hypothetical protein C8Q80DRAFT_1184386 [Daedaleopsis nitida]|nr:hypothetical protein C8Q80DRAFT_1184386 [Daedaleopsis nitida]